MDTRETTLTIRWVCNRSFTGYDYWREVTRQVLGEPARARRLTDASANRQVLVDLLAERLREGVTGDSHLLLCDFGLYRDLLNGALDHVSWRRVAEALLAEHAQPQRVRQQPSFAMTARGAAS